jgi:hypothetical protein
VACGAWCTVVVVVPLGLGFLERAGGAGGGARGGGGVISKTATNRRVLGFFCLYVRVLILLGGT